MMRRLWLPLAIAIVLHTALAVTVAPRFEIDSSFYHAQAENLVTVGASLDKDGEPETRYTPGYPLFLAAFLALGLGYPGAMAAQHVIWVALTAAVIWLVMHTSKSVVAASIAGLITTLDLPGVQSSISVLSETLAAATLTAAVFATFMSMRAAAASGAVGWAVLAGLLAGATALVRPIAILLGVPLAVAILIGADLSAEARRAKVDRQPPHDAKSASWGPRRWRILAAGALLVVFAILPVSWTIRNARQTGVATLSSLAGINLLHFRAAGTLAMRDAGGIEANLIRRREELEQQACRNLEAAHQRACTTLSWAERSREYSRVAWPVILGDPIASARQAGRALAMIVFGGSASLLAEVSGISEPAARIVALLYTVPLALLALLGIPYWWRRDRAFALLVLLVMAYMFGMALGAEAYSRFRVPVIALYAILCGGGAELIRSVRGVRL
jgi:hypothetical protein